MDHKIQRWAAAILSSVGIMLLFTCPEAAERGITDGLTVCAEILIPSLFPFMAAAGFISRSGAAGVLSRPLSPVFMPLFRLPKGACSTVLMSFIGGYPVGAAGVRSLYDTGVIDKKTASDMLTFCVNGAPAMIVAAVGKGMLGSIKAGGILYLSHILAAVLTGVIFTLGSRKTDVGKETFSPRAESLPDAFVGAVADASGQMLVICGYVVLFSAVTAFLELSGIKWASAIAEVTCGARWAAQAGLSAPVISAVLGFGGISVMCQTISLSHGLIGIRKLLLSRTVNAAFGYIICTVLIRLMPDSIETVSNIGSQSLSFTVSAVPVTVSMLIMSAVFLSSVSAKAK